jgi:flagellar motor switch protein FliN/FliY
MSVNNAPGQAQIVELTEVAATAGSGAAVMAGNLHLLDSVPVQVSVLLGQAHTTVGELMALKEQSVLKVERAVDAPVDVVVNGNVVARGQLVVVDDNFGVRITHIAAAQ